MTETDLRELSRKEIAEHLGLLPGWTFENDKISKEFKFASFREGIDFLKKLAIFCDRIDHHPDIHIYYTKILFELQRVSVGGKVTSLDFVVAREIERLYNLFNV